MLYTPCIFCSITHVFHDDLHILCSNSQCIDHWTCYIFSSFAHSLHKFAFRCLVRIFAKYNINGNMYSTIPRSVENIILRSMNLTLPDALVLLILFGNLTYSVSRVGDANGMK